MNDKPRLPATGDYFWRQILLFHVLPLMILFFLISGGPPAHEARQIYLVALRKQWDPTYLLNDWIFSRPNYNHIVFNLLFGLPTLFLPMWLINWIGTLTTWVLLLVGLQRLGSFYRVPRWMVTASIGLWLIYGQSIVGKEYIVGPFESKGVAYILLLFSLTGFLEGRMRLGGVLMGLTFSLHPAVGLWGGVAAFGALIVQRTPVRQLLEVAGLAGVFALPGVVPLFMGVFDHVPASSSEWKFLSLYLFPMHLDPFSWPRREIFLTYLLLAFNWMQVRAQPREPGVDWLLSFQLVLAAAFTVGLACRWLELFSLLRYMPFRLFPVFVLLLFFLHLARAYQLGLPWRSVPAPVAGAGQATPVAGGGRGTGLALLGLASLLSLGDPGGKAIDQMRIAFQQMNLPDDDLRRAFRWVNGHTANGSIIILPPWRKDSYALTARAQIITWELYAHDRPVEWRERMEALVGHDWTVLSEGVTAGDFAAMEAAYAKLSEHDVAKVVKRYGGDYLVSRARYSYPLLYDTGSYKVYGLQGLAARK